MAEQARRTRGLDHTTSSSCGAAALKFSLSFFIRTYSKNIWDTFLWGIFKNIIWKFRISSKTKYLNIGYFRLQVSPMHNWRKVGVEVPGAPEGAGEDTCSSFRPSFCPHLYPKAIKPLTLRFIVEDFFPVVIQIRPQCNMGHHESYIPK